MYSTLSFDISIVTRRKGCVTLRKGVATRRKGVSIVFLFFLQIIEVQYGGYRMFGKYNYSKNKCTRILLIPDDVLSRRSKTLLAEPFNISIFIRLITIDCKNTNRQTYGRAKNTHNKICNYMLYVNKHCL